MQLPLRIDPVLHGERIAVDGIPGRLAGAAGGHPAHHLLNGVAISGHEEPCAPGDGGALEKLAFAVIHLECLAWGMGSGCLGGG
ncbi:hypothetical protein D3C78_1729850 [compost metagenome]